VPTYLQKLALWGTEIACLAIFATDTFLRLMSGFIETRFVYEQYTSLTIWVDIPAIACGVAGIILGQFSPVAAGVLKSLPPLLLIDRVRPLRSVFLCVVRTISSMRNLALVAAVLLLIFAVMGMEMFMGTFEQCSANDCCSDLEGETCWVSLSCILWECFH
jgi:hypothetical protein